MLDVLREVQTRYVAAQALLIGIVEGIKGQGWSAAQRPSPSPSEAALTTHAAESRRLPGGPRANKSDAHPQNICPKK
jgi:hypothetical protein